MNGFLVIFIEIRNYNVGKSSYPNKINWKLNDPKGSIGAITVDNKEDNCRFIPGDMIDPSKIKISSRTSTRISGLPEDIDLNTFIDKCNSILHNYRQKTNDVFLTSFRRLRYDWTYRRRLDFDTLKNIMDLAYQQMIK